jgi:hypothetical protein
MEVKWGVKNTALGSGQSYEGTIQGDGSTAQFTFTLPFSNAAITYAMYKTTGNKESFTGATVQRISSNQVRVVFSPLAIPSNGTNYLLVVKS